VYLVLGQAAKLLPYIPTKIQVQRYSQALFSVNCYTNSDLKFGMVEYDFDRRHLLRLPIFRLQLTVTLSRLIHLTSLRLHKTVDLNEQTTDEESLPFFVS
jgi:hypothetical protein